MDEFTRIAPAKPANAFDVVMSLQDGLVLLDRLPPGQQMGLSFDAEEETDNEHAAFGVIICGKMYRISVERLGTE